MGLAVAIPKVVLVDPVVPTVELVDLAVVPMVAAVQAQMLLRPVQVQVEQFALSGPMLQPAEHSHQLTQETYKNGKSLD
jgi:hypothetical protein